MPAHIAWKCIEWCIVLGWSLTRLANSFKSFITSFGHSNLLKCIQRKRYFALSSVFQKIGKYDCGIWNEGTKEMILTDNRGKMIAFNAISRAAVPSYTYRRCNPPKPHDLTLFPLVSRVEIALLKTISSYSTAVKSHGISTDYFTRWRRGGVDRAKSFLFWCSRFVVRAPLDPWKYHFFTQMPRGSAEQGAPLTLDILEDQGWV